MLVVFVLMVRLQDSSDSDKSVNQLADEVEEMSIEEE